MSRGFDLAAYQTVKQRKDLFAVDYPEGVALPILITDPKDIGKEAAYIVPIFRTTEERRDGAERLAKTIAESGNIDLRLAILIMAPVAIGTAYECAGMTGASKTSWTENAEESAIGRALDNAGYHGNGKCSREEILKVKEVERISEQNPFTGKTMNPIETPLPKKGTKGINAVRELLGFAEAAGWSTDKLLSWVEKRTGGKAPDELTMAQAKALLEAMKKEAA